MIVRKNLKLSIVWQLAWRSLLFFAIMAILVALLESAGLNLLDIEPATVGPLGTALAIFLAFRNASAYDRWW